MESLCSLPHTRHLLSPAHPRHRDCDLAFDSQRRGAPRPARSWNLRLRLFASIRSRHHLLQSQLWVLLYDSDRQLKSPLSSFVPVGALAQFCLMQVSAVVASCVWKVTKPSGGTMYLGGSVHALRSTDYPLPAAYDHALGVSSRLVFEDDPKAASKEVK
jgi:hypothetical protein